MEASQIYILISLVGFLIITILMIFLRGESKNKRKKIITPLTSLAFGFVLTGIIFSSIKLVGYSLMGIGIVFAIVDMVERLRLG